MNKKKKFETRAIHDGNKSDRETGAISPTITLTSTFEQISVGHHKGFDYSRAANPTRERYEENIASLESGKFGISFSSGMAATTALFQSLHNGDHVIIGRNVYGGTYRMAVEILNNHGFEFDFIDVREIDLVKQSIKSNTKWVFVETPTNPLLELVGVSTVLLKLI